MDLIAAMLAYDPAARLTPLQALSHELFADAFPVCALLPAAAADTKAEPPASGGVGGGGGVRGGGGGAAPGGAQQAAEPPEHTPRLSKRAEPSVAGADAEPAAQPKRQARVRPVAGPL